MQKILKARDTESTLPLTDSQKINSKQKQNKDLIKISIWSIEKE